MDSPSSAAVFTLGVVNVFERGDGCGNLGDGGRDRDSESGHFMARGAASEAADGFFE